MSHRSPAVLIVTLALACTSPSSSEPTPQPAPAASSSCPTEAIQDAQAPDVTPAMEDAWFWLNELGEDQATMQLLGPAELEIIQGRVWSTPGSWRDPIDPALADPTHVQAELSERLEWLRGQLAAGKYVEGRAGALDEAAAILGEAVPVGEAEALHRIVIETPLWCVPTLAGLYTPPIDLDFDRNQCASLHLGDLVRVISKTEAWAYVDAGHSVGWIELDRAPLGPALVVDDLLAERTRPHAWVIDDYALPDHPDIVLRAGSRFLADGSALRVPTAEGSVWVTPPADAPIRPLPLVATRKALFEQAFAQLGDPYGWGGRAGHRDCSSLIFDLFAQFDVRLARNSAVQSQLGVHTIELAGQTDDAKRLAIRAAAEQGVVLLYMPGHIMLYLGHDASSGVDHDYGLSAISDYLVPCPGGSDTVHRLDRVVVTTLELGRGSQRKAYLERIERLAVFGSLAP